MFALMLAALLAAQSTGQVEKPPLPGFAVGHEQAVPGAPILEEIPEGETVQQWTRMVTTQRFEGLAGRTTAANFLARLAEGAAASCAGASASDVKQVGGGWQVRLDCPMNPVTGLPETFIAKAMMPGPDLHMVQVAWRRVPSAQDVAWGEAYLEKVAVKP